MKTVIIMKEVIKSRYFLPLFLVIILTLILSSCSTHRGIRLRNKSIAEWSSYQWKEIKKSSEREVDDWSIYSRKVKGTAFLEYKIEGDINSSPPAIIAVFKEDIHTEANALKNKKYPTYQILDESKDILLTYVIHNEPFPLKDTEMSVKYTFFNNENGSRGVSWHESWGDCSVQPSNQLSRVQTFRGSLNVSPASENSSKVVKSVNFDPKKMPLWLVKPMVFKFLKGSLSDLREMSTK